MNKKTNMTHRRKDACLTASLDGAEIKKKHSPWYFLTMIIHMGLPLKFIKTEKKKKPSKWKTEFKGILGL